MREPQFYSHVPKLAPPWYDLGVLRSVQVAGRSSFEQRTHMLCESGSYTPISMGSNSPVGSFELSVKSLIAPDALSPVSSKTVRREMILCFRGYLHLHTAK